MNQSEALQQGLIKALSHLPTIYEQRETGDWTGEYVIRYPFKEVPKNTILLMLPLRNAVDGANKLTIKYATVSGQDTVDYSTSKTYNILVEGNNGRKRPAGTGDIVANRLCVFRFITNNPHDVILCNNPVYNDLTCSSLEVTQETRFHQLPRHVYTNEHGVEQTTELVTQVQLSELEDRVAQLESRLQVGTVSPEEFFEANQNLPENSIYFQTEV